VVGRSVLLSESTSGDIGNAPPDAQPLLRQLRWIATRHLALEADLDASTAVAKRTADALDAFRNVTSDEWSSHVPSLTISLSQIVGELKKAAGIDTGAGQAAGLRDALEEATKAYGALAASPSPPPDKVLRDINTTLDGVTANQSRIDGSTGSLVAAASAARDAADIISKIDPMSALAFQQSWGNSSAQGGRSVSLKLSKSDALSKETTELATVTAVWTDSRWEVSTGALFSGLVDRTFKNTAVIVDGKPQTDSAGKINTMITESDTRPTVVPVALAHFRLWEGARYDKHVAAHATGGVGVNPYSGSAEAALGGSISYRSIVFSLLGHYGRENRLTNGLKPNDSLGSQPPDLPTERAWTWSTAVAVTARIF